MFLHSWSMGMKRCLNFSHHQRKKLTRFKIKIKGELTRKASEEVISFMRRKMSKNFRIICKTNKGIKLSQIPFVKDIFAWPQRSPRIQQVCPPSASQLGRSQRCPPAWKATWSSSPSGGSWIRAGGPIGPDLYSTFPACERRCTGSHWWRPTVDCVPEQAGFQHRGLECPLSACRRPVCQPWWHEWSSSCRLRRSNLFRSNASRSPWWTLVDEAGNRHCRWWCWLLLCYPPESGDSLAKLKKKRKEIIDKLRIT